jgi:hypothetical protein
MFKRKLIIIFLVVISLVSLFGCKRRVYDQPPVDSSNQYPASSSVLNVDVFLDATLSMKGFIVPGTATYYQQTLPLLESTVGRGWPGGQAAFYKFGTKIEPLTERKHLDAVHPEFYADPEYFRKTLIENVIDKASTDNLTVIVTDLFQDNADVNLLNEKLKGKYLAHNFAIGIVGIKSEFSGSIYDVGTNNYSFEYKGTEPERFRPFYLLVMGKHSDVEHYFDTLLESGLKSFPSKNFVIFSQYLTTSPASFEGAKINSTNKLVEISDLLPLGTKNSRARQFKISGTPPSAGFVATLNYSALRYTLEPNSPQLEPEITAWKLEPKEASVDKGANQLAGIIESNEAKRAFNVKVASISGSEIKLETELSPALLPADSVHCFRIILRPKEYRTPSWLSDWDMDTRQIEEWRKNPPSFNGATTFNLKHFLENLWATTVQLSQPKVAEVYCYIQKK